MIRRQVAVGSFWVLAQSVGLRVLTIASQLTLAWLLLPEHFGLMSLASGLSLLTDVLNQIGITEVLINRYKRFRLWGPVSHSMVIVVGVLTALVMLLLGIVASKIYEAPDLKWILAIFAIAAPIQASGIVAGAKLKAEMRFRTVAIIQVAATAASIVTAIGLAVLGFGAYSLAWPRPVEAMVRTACSIRLARVGFLNRFTFRGWRYLISDTFYSYLTTLSNIAIHQCDYLILGFFVSKAAVGVYFMAFTLSSQALSLIVLNLVGVLYPALARLSHDHVQLTRAMLKSSKVLAFASVPICALQLVNAAPFVPVILEPKWHGMIPLVQIMSVGAAFRTIGWLWRSQLKAQGEFAALAAISGVSVAVCLTMVALGCSLGGVIGCTVSISIYYMLASPLQLYFTVRKTGGSAGMLADLFARPILIATVSFACSWLATSPFRSGGQWLLEILVQSLLGLAFYGALSWIWNRDPCENIWDMIGLLRRRKREVV